MSWVLSFRQCRIKVTPKRRAALDRILDRSSRENVELVVCSEFAKSSSFLLHKVRSVKSGTENGAGSITVAFGVKAPV